MCSWAIRTQSSRPNRATKMFRLDRVPTTTSASVVSRYSRMRRSDSRLYWP